MRIRGDYEKNPMKNTMKSEGVVKSYKRGGVIDFV
jgi:hypothetical protein